jgi:hypothetical protein
MMATYGNCIGYVTTDEPWGSSAYFGGPIPNSAVVDYVQEMYDAVKNAVPADFPVCGAPNPLTQASTSAAIFDYSGVNKTRCDQVAPYCDFFAIHVMYAAEDWHSSALRAAFPGKEIAMPSCIDLADGNANIATNAAAVMGLVGTTVFKAFAWFICTDYNATARGVFNSNFTERTTKTNAFRAGVVSPITFFLPATRASFL